MRASLSPNTATSRRCTSRVTTCPVRVRCWPKRASTPTVMSRQRVLPLGALASGRNGTIIHGRDGKHCPAFQQLIDAAGVKRVPLPPRSPNLNAYAERWVRSIKEEALSRFILFGENSLRHVLREYVAHYHQERPHQGKGNVILMPSLRSDQQHDGPVRCRERLGGLLKY